MNIINKYFGRQLVGIFVMLLLILTGLAWMTQMMFTLKFLINYGANLSSFLYMTSLMIPFIASIIIPFVTFISIIFIYNKMISENEVTVMAASGLSPLQIAAPALWFAGIITVLHLILNIWIVPISQAKFYSTQWNLRYGLAHLVLQDHNFTKLSNGLVVYIDEHSDKNLKHVVLSDTRNPNNQIIVFAQDGSLREDNRAIITKNGSLQISGNNGFATGTFDEFVMDLKMGDDGKDDAFRVRRISTVPLMKIIQRQDIQREHNLALTELCSRFINPFMNVILALICTLILLKTSLLRRRTSFAPAMAVLTMAVVMAIYMSTSNMLTSITDLFIMAGGISVFILILTGLLIKK